MRRWAWRVVSIVGVGCTVACASGPAEPPGAIDQGDHSQQAIDLAQALAAKKLRVGKPSFFDQLFGTPQPITKLQERNGVHLPARGGYSLAWVEGTEFRSGTIEVEIRGKDVVLGSFVGIAFHRKDDNTYEAVYLRPYNFRATDSVRKHQAVQYIKMPDHDRDRRRKDFQNSGWENVANPVVAVMPAEWVKLRVVVEGSNVRVYVGPVGQVALEVRKLGQLDGGQVGLWTASDGDFANLVITPTK